MGDLTLKLMSDENIPDDDSRKSFFLHAGVKSVDFRRDPDNPDVCRAHVLFSTGLETFDLVGNAYVMNENGKTVSSFGPSPWLDPASDGGVTYNGKPSKEAIPNVANCTDVPARYLRQLLGCPINHVCIRIKHKAGQIDGFDFIPFDDSCTIRVRPFDQFYSRVNEGDITEAIKKAYARISGIIQ